MARTPPMMQLSSAVRRRRARQHFGPRIAFFDGPYLLNRPAGRPLPRRWSRTPDSPAGHLPVMRAVSAEAVVLPQYAHLIHAATGGDALLTAMVGTSFRPSYRRVGDLLWVGAAMAEEATCWVPHGTVADALIRGRLQYRPDREGG